MPYSDVLNQAMQHGVSDTKRFGLCGPVPLCLLSLALCVGVLGERRDCIPCPPSCSCPGLGSSCSVNCSKAGLQRAPGLMELPYNATVLDLSYNGIVSLDENLLDNLTSLEKLYLQGNNISILYKEIFAGRRYLSEIDISNNQISTLEDGIFADLFNLSKINLSFNEFVCDCNLSWLPSWMNEEEANGVIIVDSEFVKCAKPSMLKDISVLSVNFSSLFYGSGFVACLPDRQPIVNLSLMSLQNSSRENCIELCFNEGELYAALDNESHCLCGSKLEPDSVTMCAQEAADGGLIQVCGCTVIEQAFKATIANFAEPRTFSLFEAARLTVQTLVNVSTFLWDFGDTSPPFNTTSHAVFHKYGQPGTYLVSVAFFVGRKLTSLHVEINITVPPGRLEMTCPPVVQTNKSIDVKIYNWGSNSVTASWSITTSNDDTVKESPFCPSGGHLRNDCCYMLVTNNSAWHAARQFCQSHTNGDLAIVKSPEIRKFIANITGCEHPVWIGLSDTASAGTLQWVDGSALEDFPDWLPWEPDMLPSGTCVLVNASGDGEWQTDLCDAKRGFVCVYRAGADRIPGADYLLVGLPAFSTHLPVRNITVNNNAPPSVGLGELMVFPGLWFSHKGYISVVEMATENLNRTVQVRFRIYRPRCAGADLYLVTPDSEEVCTSFAVCLAGTRGNETHGCVSGTKWCGSAKACLPLKRPCSADDLLQCPNLTPPRFSRTHPSYDIVSETTWTLLPHSATHYVVLLSNESIAVQANDIVAIQHNGEPGAFIQCQRNESSPWQQNYFSIVYSSGSADFRSNLTNIEWTEGVVCNLRLLYSYRRETVATSPFLRKGQSVPGNYTYRATVDDGSPRGNMSCSVQVIAPITDFSVIYPPKQNGVHYVPKNRPVFIVKVATLDRPSVNLSGSNETFSCEATCPEDLSPLCGKEDNNTCYSYIPLVVKDCNLTSITITVRNPLGSISKAVSVRAEDMIEGLTILPDPKIRVLSNTLVTYTARVSAGTDVMFKWTVDDKASFIHYNQIYKVIYQTEAVYKLSLTASNHVSSHSIICNVIVDKRNPLAELNVSGVPAVLVQGLPYAFVARVKVDAAINATFRWSFGDGSDDDVYQFSSPYNVSLSVPLVLVTQAVLQHNVTHVYHLPGEYNLSVSASDRHDNLSQLLPLRVYSRLSNVSINASSNVIAAGKEAEFDASLLPSSLGVTYIWSFGDNASQQNGTLRRVTHTFRSAGRYNVSVRASNAISSVAAHCVVEVLEEISEVYFTDNSPTELSAPTIVHAWVRTGTKVRWTFDMGDGTPLTHTSSSVMNYTYSAVGNYTVTVVASNPLGSSNASRLVEVFVLQVCRIHPAGCVQELVETNFTAYTPGDSANYQFFWDFGDGSPNETISGRPEISHNYTSSGDFPLYLVVSSSVNKVNYYSNMCVQPAISKVVVTPTNSFIQLGEEGTFSAEAFPEGPYTYLWDFGVGLDPKFRGKEANFTFGSSGLHWVNVTALNNVSSAGGAVWVEVQAPLTYLDIRLLGRFPDNLVLDQPYTFTAASDGDVVDYTWDFGDSGNGTGVEVTRPFLAAGSFHVRLEGQNMVSEMLVELAVIVKTPLRGLEVTANTDVAPVNVSILFQTTLQAGDSIHYFWTFCQACETLEGPPAMNHTFDIPGIFNVTVQAGNGVSTALASVQVHILEEIEGLAMVLGDLAQNCCLFANQTLWFQATSRSGTEISYSWTIYKAGENFFHTNATSSQAHFVEPGSYEIVLQASNLLGTLNISEIVAVLEPIGVIALRASPEPVAVNATTVITASLGTGTEVVYTWSLEPTIVVSTTHPDIQHSFQTPGVKRVNVTAANRLSSSRATLTIQVQEPVTGVNIVAQLYVASNATTSFQGLALRGTNISWQWTLPWTMEGGRTQAINKSFPLAGVYPVGLNASNDVSWEVTSTNVSVQDEIQGLQLLVSKWAVAPGQTVLFTVLLSSGTDVTFQLGINDTFTMLRNTTEYAYNFTLLGTYRVSLTGVNRVSCGHVDVEIQVLEPVAGLWLSGCDQQAIPAGVTKTFWAEVSGGFQVSYLWHFMLGEHLDVIAGQNVSYTPKVRGWLSVLLKASNNVSSENVSARVLVQNLILAARLTASPPIAVVNETVYLSLSVTPSFTHATFLWKFGDGSQHHANTSVLSHLYTRLGVYVVKVNASNYVSFYVAQATVTILVLKCETPQMSMILSDIMRRSQRNYLEADIDLRGCAEYQVEYQWEIYKSLSCTSLQEGNEVRPKNVDLKRPRLQLPHLSLTTGRYCVQFTISFEGTSYWKAVRSIVNVIPSPLVPIIDGGTFRSWSTMQDLVMDGSRSYDPDQPLQRQAPLDYKWMCTYPCLGPAGCGISGNGIIFSIPKKELRHNTNYTCRLNVSRPDREPQYVKQLISVKGGSSPLVSLMCVSCKAQAVYGVSKSSYVYLAGSCSNCEGTPQYVWKVENTKKEVLALNNDTTSTGSNGMNLVLRHGVLEDGDGYIFSLNVTDPLMEKMGFASIYIPPIHLPSGGRCQIYPTENISALTTSVTFICTGWETAGVPLVYTFILTRCGVGGKHCDEFYVYKGSQSEYCAVLPPGFGSNQFNAYLAVTVQNQLGASVVAVNQSVVINITSTPEGFHSLTAWMKMETETKLQELLKQGDPQPTVEYALALVTVLNEYERSKSYRRESANETIRRINIRSNITLALTSLKVTTVDDIQQISAALAQCTVISREFVCGECQKETLSALDNMITVLQKETGQGKMTPTSIGDNILVTVGGLIDITNKLVPVVNKVNQPFTGNPELVATKAYNLSMKLMQILMATRVLNEEPLSVSGAKMRAQGKRADPGHLLCLTNKSGCQFSIPPSFNSVFSNISDVTQVMFLVDSNPFPYGYIKNYTISSKVASIEFKMDNGSQIPIESLDSEKAITVTVSTNSAVRNVTVNTTVIAARKSVMVNITSGNLNKRAGLHIQVTYSVLNDSGTSNVKDAEPFIQVLLHNSTKPNEHNFKAKKRIYLESVGGSDHKLYTFFLSPDMEDTAKDYYLNITNYYRSCPVQASVGVYTSLCQYFNMTAMSWKTDGILPLEDTTPTMAVCLTQHLTAFGASLFVPPNSVVFINPVALNVFCAVSRLISFAYLGGSWFICSQRRLTRANLLTRANTPSVSIIRNYIVLITCGICFVIYVVSTVIVRKLDWIDIGRVGIIPLCGKDGFYKYEILVKTGWGRGSGTSSHVGINLCGREDKSGHRHLDNEDAFHRNSVDIFQIATDNSLGNIWKIHVWHDNKGLTPSWYLQHVIIKDLQTNNVYYFLVDDWLAVDKDGIEGLVEKEVLAASESKLRDFSRIFTAEIQRGFSEGHIWLSICDRPPRSCFTRVQRVTCCLVLVYLCFCASVVWYGVINDRSISDLPVSARVPLSGESVAAGVVSCIIIYPIYLIIILLFRKSRSRVTMTDSGLHESNVLEIDDYVHPSTAGSSFLTFADNLEEDYKDKLKTDVTAKSAPGWPDYDSMMNWPDLLSDQSFMGSNVPKLRRGRGTRHLGIETQLSSDDEPLSLGYEQAMAKAFSASAEHLIQRMAFGGNNDLSTSHDSGRVSLDLESHLISNLTEIISGNEEVPTEAAIHHKASDFGQGIRPTQGIGRMANTRRIAFSDPPERCLFPFWCSYTAHALCFLLFSASITVCLWIGVCFTPRVALMWLISGIFSVLSSFFLLEPLKVLTEALYFSLVAKRIHPDEDDNLVEKPRVEQISERIGKVRPPQGYSLLQAREEARKVQILHKLLKNFIIYMLFLLVVLLINYGDSFRDAQSRLLHSSIRQGLVGVRRGVEFQKIKRSGDLFKWMSEVLLPYLYNNQSKTLIGCARLRQVRLEINQGQCLQQAPVTGQCVHYPLLQDTNHYEIGWKNPVTNRSNKWSYSTPDLPEVWYWGQTTAWDSGGYVQHLGRTMEQSNRTLWHLQESNWLDRKTRVVFVEFTQYCSNVDLYSVVTVLIEFPLLGGVFTTIDVKPFSLLRLSAGMDFPLVMMVFLMLFVIYFTISELLLICQEGKAYLFLFWNYLQWSVIILSICCVAVHLKRAKLGDRQWAHYLVHQDCFTNFYQLAYLSQVFTKLAAVLIFLLMVKVARQLRFVRRWSIFGKTLHNSGKELFAVVVASAGLLLAYAQLGYLFFSANLAHFKTFGGSVLSLLAVIQRGMNLGQCFFEYPSLCSLYYISYIVIEVWIVVRLCAAVLLQNYREIKLEMHRPAVEPQEYELAELFIRRLKMWIGVSKMKEFRHKVKFEGMVPLPTGSSRDSKSTCLHTASTISNISLSSSSSESTVADAFPPAGPNKAPQIEANIHRLLPLFETLLEQFDKVNSATEDVYQAECKLKQVQEAARQRRINSKAEELLAAYRRMRASRRLRDDRRPSPCTLGDRATAKDPQLGGSPLEDCAMPPPPRRKSKTSKMPDKIRQQTPGDHQRHSNPD